MTRPAHGRARRGYYWCRGAGLTLPLAGSIPATSMTGTIPQQIKPTPKVHHTFKVTTLPESPVLRLFGDRLVRRDLYLGAITPPLRKRRCCPPLSLMLCGCVYRRIKRTPRRYPPTPRTPARTGASPPRSPCTPSPIRCETRCRQHPLS